MKVETVINIIDARIIALRADMVFKIMPGNTIPPQIRIAELELLKKYIRKYDERENDDT